MTRWQRNLLDVLYISMESIPWFVAITFMAAISERGFLRELARELRYEASTELFQDPERVISVADALLRQAGTATSGPGGGCFFCCVGGGIPGTRLIPPKDERHCSRVFCLDYS